MSVSSVPPVISQGAIQGPEEFVEGMALGVKALVGGAVGKLSCYEDVFDSLFCLSDI